MAFCFTVQNCMLSVKVLYASFFFSTDREDANSSYTYKQCYSEIQSQAGFNGDGYIIYGKKTALEHLVFPISRSSVSFAIS